MHRSETQASLLARRAELAEERRARGALLEDAARPGARRALLNELEAAARELEAKLEGLARTPAGPRPGATPFVSLAGRLAPPVPGRVLRGFGRVLDAEYRTETFRKGVDFSVERGEPVYAVAPGEVRFAGWFAGYGRLVILDHGDSYFSVAGHLDEIAVAVGDTLGGDPIAAPARLVPDGPASTSRSATVPRRSIPPTGSARAGAIDCADQAAAPPVRIAA